VVLALVGGVAGATWGLVRAEWQRKLAEKRLTQISKGVEVLAALVKDLNPWDTELGGPIAYDQLLERARKAADELEADSVGDPLAVARIQEVLGQTLV